MSESSFKDSTGNLARPVLDANGNVPVADQTTHAGEDLLNDIMKVEQRFKYASILGTGFSQLKSGISFLHSVTINAGTVNFLNVGDAIGNGAAFVAKFDTTSAKGTYIFDVSLQTGLAIDANFTGATSVTICYR